MRHLLSLSVGLVCLVSFAQDASAVDFKIDLPPAQGTEAAVDEDLLVDVPDFPDNLGEAEPPANGITNGTAKGTPDVPPRQPPEAIRRWERSALANDLSSEGQAFPRPRCLADNVDFWERVYRDVAPSGVIFHDRENLGRVYGVANLPASSSLRRGAADLYKSYFAGKLRELADNLQNPSRWDSAQRDLARQFQGRDFNAAIIRRAADNIRLQTGLKGRFEEGIQRSLQLLPTVQRIVAEQGLPADIVLLPHVESGYHPRAVSKVGAVGLWQLMPDTMRMLLGRSFVGRRTEVEPATRAAAKLLQQNFSATKSWPLALTAYNHGLNGVLKAVRKTGSRDLCTIIERYDSPSFRFASSNFYAQFLAARNVSLARYAELARTSEGRRVLKPLLARAGASGF